MLFHIAEDNTASSVSSDPFLTCPSVNNYSFCTSPYPLLNYTEYPGETFKVPVAAVGLD